MRKRDFQIHIVRQHLYNPNVLFIKGLYINHAEVDSKIRVYMDKTELKYEESQISEYEIKNGYKQVDENVTAGVFLWIDVPKNIAYKKLRVVLKFDNVTKKVVEFSKKEIDEMIDASRYHIDAMEKIRNNLVVKGWVVYTNTFDLSITDINGNKINAREILSKRRSVKAEYPELTNSSKVVSFQLSFDCNCDKIMLLHVHADGFKHQLQMNVKCDFTGNRSFFSILTNTIRKKGFIGLVTWLIEELKAPARFFKKVCTILGIKSVVKRFVFFCKRTKKKIKEEIILRCEFKKMGRQYPNAVRKLLCLSALNEVKEEKRLHYTGTVKFSVLVPLYNTPVKFLKEMIESVQIQTYENWELCLADGSDDKHKYVEKVCEKYVEKDVRIVYKKLEKNLGISGNTNECIKMATGNFIALFDHDDFLHPMVLKKCYDVIEKTCADFVYTDEVTFQGDLDNIVTYHFKMDFAPDSLRANNYICHFSTFSKELLDKAGWYNSEYDGSQDHDLMLRLTENALNVQHIPEVLYFWRSHPGSVAGDINAKTYAIEAGKKAVAASIKRCGLSGSVESSEAFPTIYRIKYDLIDHPLISIIIPNYNHLDDLQTCIESIVEKSTYKNYEIIVVENNSDERELFEYYDRLKQIQNIRVVVWDKPFNYSAINNFAVTHAKGQFLLFLNNDIEVITPEWMEELLMYSQREDVAAVGAKLYYQNDLIQHAGIVLGMGEHRIAGHIHYKCDKNNLGYMGRLFYAQNISAVTAACMLIKKKVFEKLGGFDEKFVVAYNDVDLCAKALEAGYLNVFNPYAELYHYESTSRGMEDTPEKIARFYQEVSEFKKKWNKILQRGDKYFNKNFSLDDPWFKIEKNELFKR